MIRNHWRKMIPKNKSLYGSYTDKDERWAYVKVLEILPDDMYCCITLMSDPSIPGEITIHKHELKDHHWITDEPDTIPYYRTKDATI